MSSTGSTGSTAAPASRSRAVRALAARVSYVIDPRNDYPKNFSGHIRATLKDGTVREVRKPHMRGGAHDPLSQADIIAKFRANARFGGWQDGQAGALEAASEHPIARAIARAAADELGVFDALDQGGAVKKVGITFVWGKDRIPWNADCAASVSPSEIPLRGGAWSG